MTSGTASMPSASMITCGESSIAPGEDKSQGIKNANSGCQHPSLSYYRCFPQAIVSQVFEPNTTLPTLSSIGMSMFDVDGAEDRQRMDTHRTKGKGNVPMPKLALLDLHAHITGTDGAHLHLQVWGEKVNNFLDKGLQVRQLVGGGGILTGGGGCFWARDGINRGPVPDVVGVMKIGIKNTLPHSARQALG